MNGIFKKTIVLFLVCALFLTGGIFNAAMAHNNPTVTYSYTGDVPTGVPDLPAEHSYHYRHMVTIAAPPSLEGYTFHGWDASGVKVHTGWYHGHCYYYFFMPRQNVEITGYWTCDNPTPSPDPTPNPFNVIYAVNYMYADFIPAGAPAVPGVNYFYVGTTAQVAPAPQVAGYVFSGWKTTDVTVVNGAFAMPYKNVTFSGSWTLGTAAVPNTGGEPTVLVVSVLMLSGLVLMAVILRRKTKKSEE
jgi:hypothetical protein